MRLSRRQVCAGFGGVALLGADPPAFAHNGVRYVEIRDFAFKPETVLIKSGETVDWVNKDVVPHTATEVEGEWDTGHLEKGETARLTFHTPGRYDYFCAYHPAMKGEIIVE